MDRELSELLSAESGVRLPSGRIVRTDEGEGRQGLWLADEPARPGMWDEFHTAYARSGLWPLMLRPLRDEAEFRPWETGELYSKLITHPDDHDAAGVLREWWSHYTAHDEDDVLTEKERTAVTAPYGLQWPGLAPARPPTAEPDAFAAEYADHLLFQYPSTRLGLVAAERGADALATAAWTGPANYTNDTAEVAAVLRSWEDRFGARVVGAGSAELYLSVAAPPTTLDEALHIAAEHFAFCPDNVWQNSRPYTLTAYAESLVGFNSWDFWWD
ncbi:DUF4253 domain-containing protein [Actinomadura algeriensis]|uniref:DUF4253 domain-containing protein n=1 Tax=Actinomadura algeriensis TaxID=1679523 RepID=A0ABR9JVW4_9ACTN|nr:DUF4253 domain-containing protein [Actinomadura algeriensis]MBE1534698.1 hypothetical protein [Actinomadura algeriensis]